jgi:hypothetical protein
MNNTPLVSCICITHHACEHLKRAVESFFNQDYPEKELVIVQLTHYQEAAEYLHGFMTSELHGSKFRINTNCHWGKSATSPFIKLPGTMS